MDERFHYLCATLEKQLDGYMTFMESELRYHHFEPFAKKDLDEMFKQYEDVDVDEIALEINRLFLIPKWDILFDADDHLDSGKKSLTVQKFLITSVIHDLKSVGRLTTKYIPETIVSTINTNVLTHPVRIEAMILELTAELRLCNPSLSWQEALRERVRVAFYTMLLIVNLDVLDALTEEIDKVEEIATMLKVDKAHVDWLRGRTVTRSYSAEKERFKPKLKALWDRFENNATVNSMVEEDEFREAKEIFENEDVKAAKALLESKDPRWLKYVVPCQSNEFEAIHMFFMFAMIICVGDDFIDKEDDAANFKTTGITKALEKGIPPNHLLSTTKVYVLSNIMGYTSITSKVKTAFINSLFYAADDIERNQNKFEVFEYAAKRLPKFLALFSPEFKKSHMN